MLKQPLSAFRGQVKIYASLVLEHKQTVWFFLGLRTRNSATRNEKHEETNGKTFILNVESDTDIARIVGNSCQEY